MTGLEVILASSTFAGAGATTILGLRLRTRTKVVDQLVARIDRMVDTVAGARSDRRRLRQVHVANVRKDEQITALASENARLTNENGHLQEISDLYMASLLRETP
jgi:hypothetical protein